MLFRIIWFGSWKCWYRKVPIKRAIISHDFNYGNVKAINRNCMLCQCSIDSLPSYMTLLSPIPKMLLFKLINMVWWIRWQNQFSELLLRHFPAPAIKSWLLRKPANSICISFRILNPFPQTAIMSRSRAFHCVRNSH